MSQAAKQVNQEAAVELRRHVGEVLADARGDQPRTEVARALGYTSHVTLLRVETGDDNPTLSRLATIADALGGWLAVTFVPYEATNGADAAISGSG